MADLISRAAALNVLLMSKNYRDAHDSLEQLPAVDAAPVEWLRDMMLEREAEESRAAWVVMREWRKWKQEQETRNESKV